LKIQLVGVVLYLVYLNLMVNYFGFGLFGAWTSELVYWGIIFVITLWYLKTKRWYHLKF